MNEESMVDRKKLSGTYRRGDGLEIILFTPEEIDTSIVDMIPGDNGTEHVDGEADIRLTHLQGDEVEGRMYDGLTQRQRYLMKQGSATKVSCEYIKNINSYDHSRN
jgi:hypothetical protein